MAVLNAQEAKMEVIDFCALETDLDARMDEKKYDLNDNLCAIIKIQTTEKDFAFDTGTMTPMATIYKPGEIWLYVSEGIRKLEISHSDYGVCRYEIPLPVKSATVYELKLKLSNPREQGTYVSTATISSDYLKMNIEPKDAIVSIGRTKDYDIFTKVVTDGFYSMQLDFGDYYYKVESECYETEYGQVSFTSDSPVRNVKLRPAFNTLAINSLPESGADVTINGRYMGKTPLNVPGKIAKGTCRIRLTHNDYVAQEHHEVLPGDGSEMTFTYDMVPCYGTVTLSSADGAEIWVDNQRKAVGKWTGRLSSTSSHVVEARMPNHYSQSRSISVKNGESKSIKLDAPVPKYATLEINSDPRLAKIYIDGEYMGETPKICQVLMGEHEILFTREGYLNATEKVSLAEHEHHTVNAVMKKGFINITVTLKAENGADIYVDGAKKGTSSWKGVLPEGKHEFRTSKAYHQDGVMSMMLESRAGTVRTINLPAPEKQYATLTVKANRTDGVDVIIDGGNKGNTWEHKLPAGKHHVNVAKSGYTSNPSGKSVTLEPNTDNTVSFELKKIPKPKFLRLEKSVDFSLGYLWNSEKDIKSIPTSASFAMGLRYNRLFIGAGAAVAYHRVNLKESLVNPDIGEIFRAKADNMLVDVYGNMRFYFLKHTNKVSPFISAKAGYSFGPSNSIEYDNDGNMYTTELDDGGLFISAGIGNVRNYRKHAVSVQLDYQMRKCAHVYGFSNDPERTATSPDLGGVVFTLGFIF